MGSQSYAMTPYTATSVRSRADVFRKSIKPSVDDYDELKYNRQWDLWKNSTTITATLHRTQCVLDPDYVPATAEEHDLFCKVSHFMYNMF